MEADITHLFRPAPGLTYLDTATYGLAPRSATTAMRRALDEWEQGTARWIQDWDVVAEDARERFAQLVGVSPATVSLLPAASVGVGTVAASLPPGSRVLVGENEFTSLLFPLLVARRRGVTVIEVAIDDLAARIDETTDLVAFSLVHMQTGDVAPAKAISERARDTGTKVLIDATHGLPFVDAHTVKPDFVVCAAYKHLLCPRGTAFLTVRPDRIDGLVPWNANWRAADDRYGRYVGGPLTLAETAARFDVSTAWHLWIGAAAALEDLNRWKQSGNLAGVLETAATLARKLDLTPTGSSIVAVPVSSMDAARDALDRARIKAGVHTAAVRLACHVYTTDADVDRAVDVLRPHVLRDASQPPGR